MKQTILLLILSIGLMTGQVLAQTKVGYINPQAVLEQLPETQAVERQLTQLVQQKQAEFAQQEEAFLNRVRSLQEQVQANLISDAELTRQREQLEQMQEELYVLLDSHQNEIRRRQQELLRPILESVDRAIDEVAQELGLDYVLNELTNEGELILLFVSDNGKNSLNITNRVVQKLK